MDTYLRTLRTYICMHMECRTQCHTEKECNVRLCRLLHIIHAYTHTHMHIYDPGSAVPPPPSPPPPPPMVPPHPLPVVWCGGGLLPSSPLWCVVWLWVASPLPLVWCGSGVGFGGSPPSPPCGVVWLGGSPPACWICLRCLANHADDDIDDDDDDNHDHHYHNHLSVSWLVVGYLLPTCLLTIIALLTVGARSL